MPRHLSAVLLLAALTMQRHPAPAETLACPYKDHMRPIMATVAGYVADTTAMTTGQAETRALFIRLREAHVALIYAGPPGSATLERLLLATGTDVETAVRTWYRYRDPDISNSWLFLAIRDLRRARHLFKRMACEAAGPRAPVLESQRR